MSENLSTTINLKDFLFPSGFEAGLFLEFLLRIDITVGGFLFHLRVIIVRNFILRKNNLRSNIFLRDSILHNQILRILLLGGLFLGGLVMEELLPGDLLRASFFLGRLLIEGLFVEGLFINLGASWSRRWSEYANGTWLLLNYY